MAIAIRRIVRKLRVVSVSIQHLHTCLQGDDEQAIVTGVADVSPALGHRSIQLGLTRDSCLDVSSCLATLVPTNEAESSSSRPTGIN